MHDVVIAGASLAGSATSLELARRGLRVLLIDARPAPQPKACGEGLLPAGVAALRRLGLHAQLSAAGARLHTVVFEAGNERAAAALPGEGLGLARPAIECALLSLATRAGVEFAPGVTATGLRTQGGRVAALATTAGDLPARAFVAADGLHSRLRRLAGLDGPGPGSRYGISAHVPLGELAPAAIHVWFEGGYELYLTPVGGGIANLAALLGRSHLHACAGDPAGRLRALLAPAALRDLPFLSGPLIAGPFPRRARRPWRANLLLAGDAAGFFDGITGEGMSTALTSAPALAAAIESYLADFSYRHFRAYARQRADLVRNAELLGRLTLLLARDERLARLAVRNLARQPATFARLLAVNGGAPLRSLGPRDLLALATGR